MLRIENRLHNCSTHALNPFQAASSAMFPGPTEPRTLGQERTTYAAHQMFRAASGSASGSGDPSCGPTLGPCALCLDAREKRSHSELEDVIEPPAIDFRRHGSEARIAPGRAGHELFQEGESFRDQVSATHHDAFE